jgi:hypothetical protein
MAQRAGGSAATQPAAAEPFCVAAQLQQQIAQLRLELSLAHARAQGPRPDSEDRTAAVIAQLRREKAMLQMENKALKQDAAQWQKQKQKMSDTISKNGLDKMDTVW